jgi:hypothetical protein
MFSFHSWTTVQYYYYNRKVGVTHACTVCMGIIYFIVKFSIARPVTKIKIYFTVYSTPSRWTSVALNTSWKPCSTFFSTFCSWVNGIVKKIICLLAKLKRCTVLYWILYVYSNHRQLLRYEKKRIRINIWHQKETYFKKQLGFENVSSRAEVHSKICDQLIQA